jgi:non-canonical (house-cleaning) NTP pyrophosphatase
MEIVLGSTSKHKLAALQEACDSLAIFNATIIGFKASSNVSEQPVGFNEMFIGAQQRARGAQEHSPGSYAIGIESGIIRFSAESPVTLDIAAVVLITPDGDIKMTTSAGVQFPEQYVQLAGNRGFDTTTVGTIVTEKLGGDHTDPHATLTDGKMTRTYTLIDALVILLRQTKLFHTAIW